jgi:hypothetical protein
MHAVAIGGIEDHAHALIHKGPILGIAKTVQVLEGKFIAMDERTSRGSV